ncbi:MAG: hypothetical protein JST16_15220 [Bdellovibrionales bacterium]|nr:hypothetical protein [Bdellovibrionales bacterium]
MSEVGSEDIISHEEIASDLFAEAYPETNCFFISASRHDRDRVEIQLGFDGLVHSPQRKFEYDVDIVLFVPKTLGLLEVDDDVHLKQEFQSYVRLHTHVSNPNSETSALRVRERLEHLQERISPNRIRVLAIEFEALLKAQAKRIRKELARVADQPNLKAHILTEIDSTEFLIDEFRALLKDQGLEGHAPEEHPPGMEHDLLLLNEYISHLHVQYLSSLQNSVRRQGGADEIFERLVAVGAREAELRVKSHFLVEQRQGPNSTETEDSYLRRISILKKYFQKTVFVDIKGRPLQNKVLIPVYALAAALAASWAIMVQIYQANSLGQRVGINSIALIIFAIVTYVAKDIMKDAARKFFLSKSRMWFPDYEKKLYITRDKKARLLGFINEYIHTFGTEKVPESLHRARYSVRGGEMESYLQEDVLHFRKKVNLDLSLLEAQKEFPWGLREIVRIRFDRLLASMEDSFKTMHLLSRSGAAVTRQGHRIYHLYLATWIQKTDTRGPLAVKPAFKAFRVVLDKTGVLGCEAVKWKAEFGIPEIPQ